MCLAATPDPKALDVCLAIRSCHKNVIIKKKKTKKKNQQEEKKSESTGLTGQTLDSRHESLITK